MNSIFSQKDIEYLKLHYIEVNRLRGCKNLSSIAI